MTDSAGSRGRVSAGHHHRPLVQDRGKLLEPAGIVNRKTSSSGRLFFGHPDGEGIDNFFGLLGAGDVEF